MAYERKAMIRSRCERCGWVSEWHDDNGQSWAGYELDLHAAGAHSDVKAGS